VEDWLAYKTKGSF